MNKIEESVEFGIKWRHALIGHLNEIFRNELHFEFVHPSLRIDLTKVRSINTLLNRVSQRNPEEAVGLDIKATNLTNKKVLFFPSRLDRDRDLFLKKPGDVTVDEYINAIKGKYFFLVVNGDILNKGLTHYHLSSISDYQYYRSKSKGNTSRLSACVKDSKKLIKQIPANLDLLPIKGAGLNMNDGKNLPLKDQILNLFK